MSLFVFLKRVLKFLYKTKKICRMKYNYYKTSKISRNMNYVRNIQYIKLNIIYIYIKQDNIYITF